VQSPQDASRLWRFLYRLLTFCKPLFCRLRVEGSEHLPATGGCVIACNHSLGPDYLVLGYASPRQIFYMAKQELFQVHPWFSRFLEMVGAFPVDRGRNDTEAIGTAEALLRRGKVLGMFPEGTRSRTGELRRGKTGVARIALLAQAPVVPAVVINPAAILTQFGRRPEVLVRFGPPIYLAGDPNHKATLQAETLRIMQGIAQLLPPERRGIYVTGQNAATVAASQGASDSQETPTHQEVSAHQIE
jgi:1-acyl-sn-glycerol-3-phosphate acyltransferase